MNPYNWQSHRPQVEIPRTEVGRLSELLRSNGSAVVLGGRGMGKSVFLGQLKAELERDPETRVVLFEAPPPALTVEACFDILARCRAHGSPATPQRRHRGREAHRQVESYWTGDVAAGAVVQLTDAELPDWEERYRRTGIDHRAGGGARKIPPFIR
ncbi:MAG: hypothetical protein GY856_01660 [bacterium]|nr:hypothetical protein [bacterium]